jgi:hypothetical protein
MTRPAILLAALLAAAPAQAQTAKAPACPAGQSPMLSVRLYFGLTENGQRITQAAWEDFLDREISPRFPRGYTVTDASGAWHDAKTGTTGREPSRILEVDAPDTQELRDKAEEIRQGYAARFHQQSVGIVTLPACAAF